MQIDEIFKLWDEDSRIDVTQLQFESLKIPQLHNKYYKIYLSEKLILKKLKTKASQLKLEKQEFYLLGPTEETKAKGWVLPERGKILKPDLEPYLAADKDIIDLNLKLGVQEEKIELVRSILDTVKNRSFQIRGAIDFIRFSNGE
jgi:Recombination, repair and ssDNA binding protein UvsY.